MEGTAVLLCVLLYGEPVGWAADETAATLAISVIGQRSGETQCMALREDGEFNLYHVPITLPKK